MDDKISPEYFNLIRKVLQEKKQDDEEHPKKKRRIRESKGAELKSDCDIQNEIIKVHSSSENEIVELSSPASCEEVHLPSKSEDFNSSDDESDYESDEFEDVTEPSTTAGAQTGDLSITIDTSSALKKKTKDTRSRNVCSNEERKWRKYMHMADLVCLMIHGAIVNSWISSPRLSRRLNKLVPDKTVQLLHPEKDTELPLRSTRKLLDGLKKCMELWQKHWKITQKYVGYEYYMRQWNDINYKVDSKKVFNEKALSERLFIRQVLKGHGNRDVANQGFVALLRSCNVNARMIMSCQPPDFTDLKEKTLPSSSDNSYDSTFKYPIFWCEVWDKFSKKWITIDAMNLKTIEQIKINTKLEPKGVASCKRNLLRYAIAYDRKDGCRDVTRRYCFWYTSKCRKRRVTKDLEGTLWYEKVLSKLHRRKRTKIDDYEDEYMKERDEAEGMPDSLQDLKNHPKFILETDLRANQMVKADCKECGYLNVNHGKKILKVYERDCILNLKSPRQWYSEGRILKIGSKARKAVLKRRGRTPAENEENEEERLYSIDDTEIYTASLASVPDGKIAKNTFGNIEVFTPTMIPANCCLIKSPVAIKAANFLQVEYARAVTGFKFERGNTTKPIIDGVVVAYWFKEAMLAAIDGIEYCMERQQFEKQELENLNLWNVLLMKLRIKGNLNASYGKVRENEHSETWNRENHASSERDFNDETDDLGGFGGFLPLSSGGIPVEAASQDPHPENSEEEYPLGDFGGTIPSPVGDAPAETRTVMQNPHHENNEEEYSLGDAGGFVPCNTLTEATTAMQNPYHAHSKGEFAELSNNADELEDNQEERQYVKQFNEQPEIEHYDDDYDQFMDELNLSEAE